MLVLGSMLLLGGEIVFDAKTRITTATAVMSAVARKRICRRFVMQYAQRYKMMLVGLALLVFIW